MYSYRCWQPAGAYRAWERGRQGGGRGVVMWFVCPMIMAYPYGSSLSSILVSCTSLSETYTLGVVGLYLLVLNHLDEQCYLLVLIAL